MLPGKNCFSCSLLAPFVSRADLISLFYNIVTIEKNTAQTHYREERLLAPLVISLVGWALLRFGAAHSGQCVHPAQDACILSCLLLPST